MEPITLFLISLAFGQTPNQTAAVLPAVGLLPEHPLYNIQSIIEKFRIFMAFNDVDKANYELQLAQLRLAEINAEIQKGNIPDAQKAQRLHDEEINDLQAIEARQKQDTRGFQIRQLIEQQLQSHNQTIGLLVSNFVHTQNDANRDSVLFIGKSLQNHTDFIEENIDSDIKNTIIQQTSQNNRTGLVPPILVFNGNTTIVGGATVPVGSNGCPAFYYPASNSEMRSATKCIPKTISPACLPNTSNSSVYYLCKGITAPNVYPACPAGYVDNTVTPPAPAFNPFNLAQVPLRYCVLPR